MEVELEGPRGLFCTAAANLVWVFVINVLRNVASNWRCTSNVINTLSVDESLISLQTDLYSEAGSSKNSNTSSVGIYFKHSLSYPFHFITQYSHSYPLFFITHYAFLV